MQPFFRLRHTVQLLNKLRYDAADLCSFSTGTRASRLGRRVATVKCRHFSRQSMGIRHPRVQTFEGARERHVCRDAVRRILRTDEIER